jgi:hypothetical protein
MKTNFKLHAIPVSNYLTERNLVENVISNSSTFRVFVGYDLHTSQKRIRRYYTIYRIQEESLVSKTDTIITRYGILVDGKKLIADMKLLEEVHHDKDAKR